MNKKNGYRNFSFGDIIIFPNDDAESLFRNKKFKFICVDGEDYILYDIKAQTTECVRAYYFNKFKKVKEEQKTITTWELTYEEKIN